MEMLNADVLYVPLAVHVSSSAATVDGHRGRERDATVQGRDARASRA